MSPKERLPEPFTFYIDRCLGKRDVPDAIRGRLQPGERLVLHHELFAPDAPDEEWLSHVGLHKWIALSKDAAIRRRPGEVDALLAARTAVFLFGNASLTGAAIGLAFSVALPRIRKAARRFEPAIIGRVNQAGEVSVAWASGAKLEKPAALK